VTEPTLFFAGAAGLVVAAGVMNLWFSHVTRRARILEWRPAARRAGVTELREGVVGAGWDIAGRLESRMLFIGQSIGSSGRHVMRIRLQGGSSLTLRRQAVGESEEGVLGAAEVEFGDAEFDRETYVLGLEEMLRAVLSAETRQKLRDLGRGWVLIGTPDRAGLEAQLSVRYGDIHVEVEPRHWRECRHHLGALLRVMRDLADRLEPPGDLASAIAHNTAVEPEPRVRLANIRLLAAQYPRHPATPGALRAGCSDPDDDVRLVAARALGAEGRPTLVALALEPSTEDWIAAEAVGAASAQLTTEQALALLPDTVRESRLRTAAACAGVLGRRGGIEALDRLSRLLGHRDESLVAAAVEALGMTRDARAEAPLLKALGRREGPLRVAAAAALGRAGTTAAVPALREAERGILDGDFRRAARQAIAEIQGRASGASPGQLSLADDAGGRLSLADVDPRGRVAIVEGAQERTGQGQNSEEKEAS
jgi:hypothetical protein